MGLTTESNSKSDKVDLANDVRNYSGVTPVPINKEWRLSLLPKMLIQRNKLESNFEDTKTLTIMIDSLCTS